MKKFLIGLAKYGLLFFVLLNGIAALSLFALQKSNFYKPGFVRNGLTSKNYDYAVLGSSTGLTGLDTKYIDSITGKNGINISMDDSSMSSHFLMLQHFLTLKNKTKTLVLTVTPLDADVLNPKLSGNDYRFLPFVYSDYVFDYYASLEKSCFKPLTFSKYFPIIGVSYYNTELFYPAMVAAIQPKKRNRFDDRGNYCYPENIIPANKKETVLRFKSNNPYLVKIKDLCAENNIKLIYYLPPMYRTKVIPDGIFPYINHSGLLQDVKYFYDYLHINAAGRKVCSTEFAQILGQNN